MTYLRLSIAGGPKAGTVRTVAAGEALRVGRGASCDWSVIDPSMSRDHFEVVNANEGFLLRDLSSRNGTRLNGCRLAAAEGWVALRHGDLILAGCTAFRVDEGDGVVRLEGPSTPTGSGSEAAANRETWEVRPSMLRPKKDIH